jgi:hypothetical protein
MSSHTEAKAEALENLAKKNPPDKKALITFICCLMGIQEDFVLVDESMITQCIKKLKKIML